MANPYDIVRKRIESGQTDTPALADTNPYAQVLRKQAAERARLEERVAQQRIDNLLEQDPLAAATELQQQLTADDYAQAGFAPADTGDASPFRFEPGLQKRGEVTVTPMHSTESPRIGQNQAVRTIAASKYHRLKRERGLAQADVTPEIHKELQDESLRYAARLVAGKVGRSEERKNLITGPISEEERKKQDENLYSGRHWLGVITGAPALSAAKEAAGLDPDLKFLAPWYAMAQPGYTKTVGESDDVNYQRESKFWWLLRTHPSTVYGSWLFDPEVREAGWGSPEHLNKIRSGYEVFHDQQKFGEYMSKLTPWEEPEILKKAQGWTTAMALAVIGPDPISIGLGGAGAAVKGVKSAGGGLASAAVNIAEPAIKKAIETGSWDTIRKMSGPVLAPFKQGLNAKRAEVLMRELEAALDAAGRSDALKTLVRSIRPEATDASSAAVAGLRGEADRLARGAAKQSAKLRKQAEKMAAKSVAQQEAKQKLLRRADQLWDRAQELRKEGESLANDAAAKSEVLRGLEAHGATIARAQELVDDMQTNIGVGAKTNWAEAGATAVERYSTLLADSMAEAAQAVGREMPGGLPKNISDSLTRLQMLMEQRKSAGRGWRKYQAAMEDEYARFIDLLDEADVLPEITEVWLSQLRAGDVDAFFGLRRTILDSFSGVAIQGAQARIRAARALQAKLVEAALDLGIDPKDLRNIAKVERQAAKGSRLKGKGRSGAARAGRAIKRAAKKGRSARAVGAAAVDKATEANDVIMDAVRRRAGLNDIADLLTPEHINRVAASEFLADAQTYRKLKRAGRADVRPYTGSEVIKELVKREGDAIVLDPGESTLREALRAKYGTATDSLGSTHLDALLDARGKVTLTGNMSQELNRLEEALFKRSELNRLRGAEATKTVIDTIAGGQAHRLIPRSSEEFVAHGLQWTRWLARLVDPEQADGMLGAIKPVREIFKRSRESGAANELEVNAIYRNSGGDFESVWKYLTTNEALDTGGALSVGNRGAMSHTRKALRYLQWVAKTDGWKSDAAVRSIANMWLPKGKAGTAQLGENMEKLRDIVLRGDIKEFEEALPETMQAVMGRTFGKSDEPAIAFRFLTRALLHASTMHDASIDLMRLTGPGLGKEEVNNGLNFLIDLSGKQLERGLTAGQVERARELTAIFGTGVGRREAAVGTDVGNIFKMSWVPARKRAIQMMTVAEIEGKGLTVPGHIWEALQSVGHKVAKESETFHWVENDERIAKQFLDAWRVGVVNGWLVPRPAHFMNTFVGDVSQIATSVGWRPAIRYGLQASVSYIPFVGLKVQDAIGDAARRNSLLGYMVNPQLSRIMKGDEKLLLETPEGIMTGRDMLRDAHADGMWDSISTRDLEEAASRGTKGLMERWGLTWRGPSEWVNMSARKLEAIQHRQRVALYVDARTGALTGKPMSRAEARKLALETLYDWRGAGNFELETVARLGAFWMYRRGMLKQLGAVLGEGIADPGLQYWAKAATGRTKFSRMRSQGAGLAGIPEAIYWEDPNELVDDQEQFDMWGRRTAPWWAEGEALIATTRMKDERREFYSEMLGKKVNFESFIMPSMTTLDQLSVLNMFAQTGAATTIMLAETAGLEPKMTSVGAKKVAENAIEGFSDNLNPATELIIEPALRAIMDIDPAPHSRDGIPVSKGQALMLKRLGWNDFIGWTPDQNGRLRFDPTAAGFLARLASAHPALQDVGRNWAAFDNPSMQADFMRGTFEAVTRVSGAIRFGEHDPLQSRQFDIRDIEGDLKEAIGDEQRRSKSRF